MNVLELFKLTNKKALVTGGAKGIGRKINEGLLEQFKQIIFSQLQIVRVYSKPPGKQVDENEPFIRVFGPERPHSSTDVRGSNFCNLSVNIDDRTGKLIVISLIDNLMKGQAGSAVQNMNIMFGLDETAGLMRPGLYP